jgi:hypothetical protein
LPLLRFCWQQAQIYSSSISRRLLSAIAASRRMLHHDFLTMIASAAALISLFLFPQSQSLASPLKPFFR